MLVRAAVEDLGLVASEGMHTLVQAAYMAVVVAVEQEMALQAYT